MRDHLAADLQALAAFFGAARHVLVALELLALGGALVAGLCAGLADYVAEWAVSRNDARGGRTRISTVLTRLQCHHGEAPEMGEG